MLDSMTEQPFLESMANDYQQIYGGDKFKREELLEKWKSTNISYNLRGQICKVNKTIKEGLTDETLHPFYEISSKKKYACSRYGIRVEKGLISIV
jgi:hypothetical protein